MSSPPMSPPFTIAPLPLLLMPPPAAGPLPITTPPVALPMEASRAGRVHAAAVVERSCWRKQGEGAFSNSARIASQLRSCAQSDSGAFVQCVGAAVGAMWRAREGLPSHASSAGSSRARAACGWMSMCVREAHTASRLCQL